MFSKSRHTIAIPPSETIREQLKDRGMTQKEFAIRMGLTEKHVSQLLNGQVELTQNVALRLEAVLGVPASYWNNLEMIYREKLARVEAENELEEDAELASRFPYAKMAELQWVCPTRNRNEKALNLREFFEVARLNALGRLCVPGIAYRVTGGNDTSDYSLAAWAQKARIDSRDRRSAPVNISKLQESIPKIRKMTILNPAEFSERLVDLLSECGIVLVFLPHIGGSFLHGASFNDGNRIVMGLTVRGRDADRFWFSLFHELCHIIRGHINSPDENDPAREAEADDFAKDILVPSGQYQEFIDHGCFSKESIEAFAKEIGVAPGIVLGRLQKENYIPYNRYNELKVKYEIC
ncbi:MAG: helix-turn-helix domain-containing protein [Eubacteriales bacterium]|nr:helix-turn-helix domain-containing protein [Eubacteriales bacterium]